MKKIFYILACAIVALGAVACENEGLENINPSNGNNNNANGLTIVANIDEATKVAWEGLTPSWEAGDSFKIGDYTFTTTDGSAFVCEDSNVYTLVGSTVDITLGTLNSSAGVEGTVFTANDVKILAEGTTANFKPATALLKYTTTAEGVTFAGSAINDSFTATNDGEVHYIAVKAGEEVDFSYSVNDFECKSLTNTTFTAGKVYNLGDLEAKAVMALVPGEFWKSANARFAAYFFKEEVNSWVDMTEQNGKYVVEVPEGEWDNVIFCRMNPATTDNNWDNMWNQTADLEINKCQYYHVIGWTDQVAWTTSATRPTVTEETSGKYVFLKPNSNWKTNSARFAVYSYDNNGNEWDNMNKLTDDLYWISVSEIKAKVGSNYLIFCRMNPATTDNNWDNKWNQAPGSGGYQIASGKNCFTVSGWDSGSWSNYTAF